MISLTLDDLSRLHFPGRVRQAIEAIRSARNKQETQSQTPEQFTIHRSDEIAGLKVLFELYELARCHLASSDWPIIERDHNYPDGLSFLDHIDWYSRSISNGNIPADVIQLSQEQMSLRIGELLEH
jgi:hypothetical protein